MKHWFMGTKVSRLTNHRTDSSLVQKAISLYTEKYYNFGPTFAREKMLELDGLVIGVDTLRRAIISAGLWKTERVSIQP